MAISSSITQGETVTGGISASITIPIINGNAGLNLGRIWVDSQTYGETVNCGTTLGNEEQVWAQHLMGWANSQQQTCYQSCGLFGCYDPTCGDWSAYQHDDFPVLGAGNINWGCSTGCTT